VDDNLYPGVAQEQLNGMFSYNWGARYGVEHLAYAPDLQSNLVFLCSGTD
jgi:hypothetical protein